MKGYAVYFIQIGTDGPIKIGRTEGCPLRRMANLQTACPFKLRLLAVIRDAPVGMEATLHGRFALHAMEGEWFEPADDLLAYIKAEAVVIQEQEASVSDSVSEWWKRPKPGKRLGAHWERATRDDANWVLGMLARVVRGPNRGLDNQ